MEKDLLDALANQIADGRSVGIIEISRASVGKVHLHVDDALIMWLVTGRLDDGL